MMKTKEVLQSLVLFGMMYWRSYGVYNGCHSIN